MQNKMMVGMAAGEKIEIHNIYPSENHNIVLTKQAGVFYRIIIIILLNPELALDPTSV